MSNESSQEKSGLNLVETTSSTASERKDFISTPKEITEKGAVSNNAIAGKLTELDLKFEGSRDILSSGALGPIYRVEAKTQEGEPVVMIEKVFGRQEKRFTKVEADSLEAASVNIRPRLGIVDKNSDSGKLEGVVIDWLFNEEQALKDLEGIPGIPKSYGAVYEGKCGSILEQFIDGYDIVDIAENSESTDEINQVFDRYVETYTKAAENGYVYNNPYGATAMVDKKTKQPYLMDWYQHGTGSIDSEGPVREKYLRGLQDIKNFRQETLDQWSQKQAEKIRDKIQASGK
jgi:hypothetical protein